MNKKFAVKVHNEFLSEAVQKMAFKYGYKWLSDNKFRCMLCDRDILYFNDKDITQSNLYDYDSMHKKDYPDFYSAKTDWDKIEEAMKPVKPREIWVNEYEDGKFGLIYANKVSAESAKDENHIRTIKFREVTNE